MERNMVEELNATHSIFQYRYKNTHCHRGQRLDRNEGILIAGRTRMSDYDRVIAVSG